METFHCAATMDDDHEGAWREILQKWDSEHALAADQGLRPPAPPPLLQQPTTCTSMLSPLAMESLNSIFLPLNPNSTGSDGLHLSPLPRPHSFTQASMNHQHSPPPANPLCLEAAVADLAPGFDTSDGNNLIGAVGQPNESGDAVRSSWLSTFLQSLTPTGLAASSLNNLLHMGDDQGGLHRAMPVSAAALSKPEGLDEIMEQMGNDFINYGGAGSLQEQLSNALCASDMAIFTSAENDQGLMGSGSEGMSAHNMLLHTPASSVSSDGGQDDDSDSHEDLMANSALHSLDDLINMPSADHPHLSIRPSSDTPSSKGSKVQGETSSAAAPPSSHDQDKKRSSKSGRLAKRPKRERGSKLAIKIQSDVEILDDGYKWRKYGQKAVKNSPYPRSYYKCTDKQCKVKKHVERQVHEPDYVVTTYEGVHNHSRPDQQVQVLHSQSDITSQQHDSFQAFMPTTSIQHLSTMEILGLQPSSLFQGDSHPMSLPLQQGTPSTQSTFDALDLQNLLHGEPRRSLA